MTSNPNRAPAFCDDVHDELLFVIDHEMSAHSPQLRDIASAGGKYLRSRSLFEAAEAAGSVRPYGDLVRLAAGVELLHLGTLIHDDFVDGATLRRNTSTLPPDERALLSGLMCIHRSVLIVTAFRPDYRLSFAARLRALAVGQLNDLERASTEISDKDFVSMHARKTGALFAVAVELGMLCGAARGPLRMGWARTAGENIGVCFQIVDDLNEARGLSVSKSAPDAANGLGLFHQLDRPASESEALDIARKCLDSARLAWTSCFGSPPRQYGIWASLQESLDVLAS